MYEPGLIISYNKPTDDSLDRSVYQDFTDSARFGHNCHYSNIISASNWFVGDK